ncbi:MAG: flagellar biosynthesis regulator FlaF [Salaquimonas sp.]|nr:flagellar biosynthesis regulator FlaF [Salaquimonas sp.]
MHNAYDEIAADSGTEARLREREALLQSIVAMEEADRNPSDAVRRTNAIVAVNRLWSTLVTDLASAQNQYPRELKAQLISIGIFVLRQCEAMRTDENKDFAAIVDISRTLEKGLA